MTTPADEESPESTMKRWGGCALITVLIVAGFTMWGNHILSGSVWHGAGPGSKPAKTGNGDPVAEVQASARSAISGDGVQVTYDGYGPFGGVQGAEGLFFHDVAEFMPIVLKTYPAAQWYSVTATTDFTDLRGNVSKEAAFSVSFWRRNAESIRWENINTDNVSKLCDKYWCHPAIARQATEEIFKKLQ